MISEYIKIYAKSICIVLITVIIGIISMIAIYSIPAGRMYTNAQKSIKLYEAEGVYPSWANGKISSRLDNFTDSIMVQKAIFPGSGNIVNDAMLNPSYSYDGETPVGSLLKTLQGESENRSIHNYARYWHGYLLILKPLLLLRPVQDIRELNGFIQILLAAYCMFLIGKNYGYRFSIAYLLTYLSLNPISLAMSFQFSTMFYIISVGVLFALKKPAWLVYKNNYILFFTILGTATAYFDFLTYPLASLGIPLIILSFGMDKKGFIPNRLTGLRIIITAGLGWSIGYAGMYIGKWIMSWILTGYNTLQEAIACASFRMSSSSEVLGAADIHVGSVFLKNINVIIRDQVFLPLLAALLFSLYSLYKVKRQKESIQNKVHSNLTWLLFWISLFPFFWFSFLKNHSFIHFWFTYRELSITILAIGFMIAAKLTSKNK